MNGYEVHVEDRFQLDAVALYVRRARLGGWDYLTAGGDVWVSPEQATPIEPTVVLPRDAYELLVKTATLPAPTATERHLLDTVAVRDRLLDLTEALSGFQRRSARR